MKTVKRSVRPGQNLFDFALSATGTVEAAWEIARLNDLAMDTVLVPGQVLAVPTSSTWLNDETLLLLNDLGALPLGTGEASVSSDDGLEFNTDFNTDFA